MARIPGYVFASLAAGPIFTTGYALAGTYLTLPAAIVVAPAELMAFAAILIPATLFGAILSMAPNALGTLGMRALGDVLPASRSPVLWFAAGSGLGLALARLTGAFESPETAFGLVATSALCAWICRLDVEWD